MLKNKNYKFKMNKITFENWNMKTTFEYQWVWDAWDQTLWNPGENIFLQIFETLSKSLEK
jgi:hypothetical protein